MDAGKVMVEPSVTSPAVLGRQYGRPRREDMPPEDQPAKGGLDSPAGDGREEKEARVDVCREALG